MRQYVNHQFEPRLEVFRKTLTNAADHPQDAEAIHDLRVSIRRLTQCLQTFPQFFRSKRAKKARTRLKCLLDHCGEARNCDISIDVLRDAGLNGHPAIEHLQAKRAEAEAALVNLLAEWTEPQSARNGPQGCLEFWGKRLPRGKSSIKKHAKKSSIHWRVNKSIERNAARVLPKLAKRLFAEGDRVAAPGVPYKEIHKFRLHGKRFRYTLELFDPVYGENLLPILKGMKRLQDLLGVMNDCVTARKIIPDDAAALAAIDRLLEQREGAFRAGWADFDAELRRQWKQVLRHPEAKEARKDAGPPDPGESSGEAAGEADEPSSTERRPAATAGSEPDEQVTTLTVSLAAIIR